MKSRAFGLFYVPATLTLAACSTPTPSELKISDSWGKHLYATTEMVSVYPPRSGIFPGDIYALCETDALPERAEASTILMKSATSGDTQQNMSTEKKELFGGRFMGRTPAFYKYVVQDLQLRPNFTRTKDQTATDVALEFPQKNGVVVLDSWEFPVSSFYGVSNTDVGLSGTAGVARAGLGANRHGTNYFALSLIDTIYSHIPFPDAEDALNESWETERGKRILRSFNGFRNDTWHCKVGLFAVWKVNYMQEIAFSYGESLAQAFAAQLQVQVPADTTRSRTNVALPNSVPDLKSSGTSPSGNDATRESGTAPTTDQQKKASSVEKQQKESAEAATKGTNLGVQGGRLNTSNAFESGIGMTRKLRAPTAVGVTYIQIKIGENGVPVGYSTPVPNIRDILKFQKKFDF